MPTLNHDANIRGFCSVLNQESSGYSFALAETSPDLIAINSPAPRLGFWALGTFDTQISLFRLDLRRYRGQKVTAVSFKTKANSAVKTLGGNINLELRSHTRTNRGGLFAAGDHQTPAEMTAQTLYATAAIPSGTTPSTTWSNSGTALIDAINAAIDSDGIIDFLVCVDNQRANTPPSGSNEEYVTLVGGGTSVVSSPFDDEAHFALTITAEQEHHYVETHLSDYFRITMLNTVWNNVLTGVGPVYDSSPDSSDAMTVHFDSGFSRYAAYQLFMRFDLSGVDTTKAIKSAKFCIYNQNGFSGASAKPWHIRRYDWTTEGSGHYRTQSQLGLLTKVCEFTTQELIDNGGFPSGDPDEDCNVQFFIDGGQELIDIVSEAPALAGFVIHSERMITGTAPTTTSEDAFSGAFLARDRVRDVATGIVIEYDDGSSFFSGVF